LNQTNPEDLTGRDMTVKPNFRKQPARRERVSKNQAIRLHPDIPKIIFLCNFYCISFSISAKEGKVLWYRFVHNL
jgi:hypothetical protein